jgi:broad specificity phosphatase PhoE
VALYTSDLCRASQTAEPVERVLGVEAVPMRDLREIALGAWEGKTREEIIVEFPELWSAWTKEPDWDVIPGGEGAVLFERRVRAALADLFARHPGGGDVVVITHGGVIQTALAGVVGRRTRGVFPFVIHNASLTVLQRFDSRTVVTVVNDTCHLT